MSTLPQARTLGALVDEYAAATPTAPAISFDGSTTTFSELKVRSDALARAIVASGLEKGQAIGVLAGNRTEWLVCTVAAAKVGVVVVPLNTWYKADELAYTIAHGDVETIFYTPELRGRDYAGLLAEALELLEDQTYVETQGYQHEHGRQVSLVEIAREVVANPAANTLEAYLDRAGEVDSRTFELRCRNVGYDDLLCIIYTSGSTSRPKGVRIEHGHFVVNTFNIGERQGVVASDRSFVATPLFYGLGLLQALGATWTHGACVVLMEVYEPGSALQLLEREHCTVFYGLGNMTRSLVEHPDLAKRDLVLTKGVLGLGPTEKSIAYNELGLRHGVAIYGLTESHGLCATSDWRDDFTVARDSIGRALPGWDIQVCDPVTDQPLPPNDIGQILIRGHLSSGYHKDEKRNRETFTADGYFRTGDLGWLDEPGNLYFHSRLSEMMKPGGINVSPLEVENLIAQLPGVREVHVVGVPAGTDGDDVIAFVQADTQILDEDSVINHVRSVAAKYKAPTRVFFVNSEELPRVASGKVPKVRLRELAVQLME